MVSIGMIFQFNTTEGAGLIMLSNGETKEFNIQEWTDTDNEAAIGLEVLYESDTQGTKIKVPTVQEKAEVLANKTTKQEADISSCKSLQDYQVYFSNKGFESVKNIEENSEIELSMAKFSGSSLERIAISFENFNVQLNETSKQLITIQDYIECFQTLGYKLAKDVDIAGVRTASLRRFLENGHGEMIITSSDSSVKVQRMVNGKEVIN